MSQVSDAAAGGAGKAQQGLGAAGYNFLLSPSHHSSSSSGTEADYSFYHSSATKDVTSPIPVVGSVVEGVGNAPIAQKIGGKEEEKGYLGSVYDYAGSALRTVYDAAGNVVCTFLFLCSSSRYVPLCFHPPLYISPCSFPA